MRFDHVRFPEKGVATYWSLFWDIGLLHVVRGTHLSPHSFPLEFFQLYIHTLFLRHIHKIISSLLLLYLDISLKYFESSNRVSIIAGRTLDHYILGGVCLRRLLASITTGNFTLGDCTITSLDR